jgi:predicted ATPase with chaperone activity
MSTKYEFMTDDEIIKQYKIIKEKERTRNKEAYERLKLNSVKYRQRLTNAYNNQVERMNKIKQNEDIYNEWLMNNKITQSKSYFKRVEAEADLKMMILNDS